MLGAGVRTSLPRRLNKHNVDTERVLENNLQAKISAKRYYDQSALNQPLNQLTSGSPVRVRTNEEWSDQIYDINRPGDFLPWIDGTRKCQSSAMSDVITRYFISIPQWWLKTENIRYLKSDRLAGSICDTISKAVNCKWSVEGNDVIAVVRHLMKNEENFLEIWAFQYTSSIDEWLVRSLSDLKFEDTVDSHTKKVICDLIPDSVRNILEEFCRYRQHELFLKMLHVNLNIELEWNGIVTTIRKVMQHFDDLIDSIKAGTIKVSNLKELQAVHFGGSKEELLRQISLMLDDKNLFELRERQIDICLVLEQYGSGANILLEMQKTFDLQGDFFDLEKLSQAREQVLELRSVSEDFMNGAEMIRQISEKQLDCLRAFAECADFVNWVHEEVQKNDIRIFVDLARNSLGEDDLANQKTRFLLNALNGYSPLLYEFTPNDRELSNFLELCKRVWSNMDKNPALADNLRMSSSQLTHFKKVKGHYGSTEMTAVSQAAAINATGKYEVGQIYGYSNKFKTLDDVVRLTCQVIEKSATEEKQKTVDKRYTYSDLKDLQSRLALVAGDKQKDSADTFTQFDEMRDAVENLARAYIEVRREGCIQFDDLKVVIHCNQSHAVAIEIKLQTIEKSFSGPSSEGTSLQHCHNMYKYLIDCIKRWRESMDEKRSKNPELNYYTTEQLILLRKELGKLNSTHDVKYFDQAQGLLAMIRPVQAEDLLLILDDFERLTANDNDEEASHRIKYEDLSQEHQDIVNSIFSELEEVSSKEAALEIFNKLGEDDARDLELVSDWLDEQKAANEEAAKKDGISEEFFSKAFHSFSSLKERSLKQKLETLWEEFIAHTSKSISNFLGIPQLAYVLKRLKVMNRNAEKCRTLPNWLERGKPVLIPVPREQTFQLVLTIYEADSQFESPTRNEVLICNKQTRKDEVGLFLNRALHDGCSFYCLVNCHLLKYDVCDIIENRLSHRADHDVDSYGLAFIFAAEAKDARIKTYLDKQLVRHWQPADEVKLKAYVKHLLHAPESIVKTACYVDPQRSSARLIRSSRAGVGKSLQHKNLRDRLRSMCDLPGKDLTICLHKFVNTDDIIDRLVKELPVLNSSKAPYHTIHLDIAHEVEHGVDELLFNLVILRSLVNSEGVVWQVKKEQYYIIECMPFTVENDYTAAKQQPKSAHEVIDFLPTTQCITPQEAYKFYNSHVQAADFIGFDQTVLSNECWQLVLNHLDCKVKGVQNYTFSGNSTVSDPKYAIKLLVENCGLTDPTWLELCHYVHFLSSQLTQVLKSAFCSPAFQKGLPGFKAFAINFMLKMSQDFATRSLKIVEETPGQAIHQVAAGETEQLFENLTMKKTWEQSNYPYLFINEDGESFTALGFDAQKGF
ncbi:E3 ubiquitin-protein ligase rnf213-alpha-like [Watersipora subatra]|uniref:E3 ubiquitin-protein ligase rnf213-alpha-like n=1 Tax=Watersipora subatra TaxID=2589382 RepID=UPI00355B35A1